MAPRLTPEERELKRLANRSRAERWSEGLAAMRTILEDARSLAEDLKTDIPEEPAVAEKEFDSGLKDARDEERDNMIGNINSVLGTFSTDEIDGLKEEYDEWRGNMPDALQDSPTMEKLNEVCDCDTDFDLPTLEEVTESDIDSFIESIEEQLEKIDELENIDLPRGFGRD